MDGPKLWPFERFRPSIIMRFNTHFEYLEDHVYDHSSF